MARHLRVCKQKKGKSVIKFREPRMDWQVRRTPAEKFQSKWGGGYTERFFSIGEKNLLLRESRDLKLTRKLPIASIGQTENERNCSHPFNPSQGLCLQKKVRD